MDFVIGTAQFGQQYGITNTSEPVDASKADQIMKAAHGGDVNMLDTAQLYGDSETVLGACDLSDMQIVTKLKIDSADEGLEEKLMGSLERLKVESVYGLLIHNADILDDNQTGSVIWEKLEGLKNKGLVQKIGVSVYDPEHLASLIQTYAIDLVQFPCNLLDQRFLSNAIQQELKGKNIEQHARSLFLQGVLLAGANTLPDRFEAYAEVFKSYFDWREEQGLNPVKACLAFAKWVNTAQDIPLKFVIGVSRQEDLEEILHEKKTTEILALDHDFAQYRCDQPSVIDPRTWSQS